MIMQVELSQVSTFIKEFTKLVKMAKKMSLPIPTYKFNERESLKKTIHMDFDGEYIKRKIMIDVQNIELDILNTYKFSGWNLIGIVFFNEGGVILTNPSYLGTYPSQFGIDYHTCDHCNGVHYGRSKSFIVKDNEGNYKQVGSTCVNKFLGYTPATILKLNELLNECIKVQTSSFEDEDFKFGSTPKDLSGMFAIDLDSALAYSKYQIEKDSGFVSKKYDYSGNEKVLLNPDTATVEVIKDNINNEVEMPTVSSEYKAGLIAYLDGLEYEIRNFSQYSTEYEYMEEPLANRIKDCMNKDAMRVNEVYLVALAVNNYNKFLNTKPSNFVGEIKERKDFELTLVRYNHFEGYFGTTHVYTFEDKKGNCIVYMGSAEQDIEVGDNVKIKGTIKKHDTYKGLKQTHISRIKVSALA